MLRAISILILMGTPAAGTASAQTLAGLLPTLTYPPRADPAAATRACLFFCRPAETTPTRGSADAAEE